MEAKKCLLFSDGCGMDTNIKDLVTDVRSHFLNPELGDVEVFYMILKAKEKNRVINTYKIRLNKIYEDVCANCPYKTVLDKASFRANKKNED